MFEFLFCKGCKANEFVCGDVVSFLAVFFDIESNGFKKFEIAVDCTWSRVD